MLEDLLLDIVNYFYGLIRNRDQRPGKKPLQSIGSDRAVTQKEVLELIVKVANEANEYLPCLHIAKAARGLLDEIELKESEPPKPTEPLKPKKRRPVLVEGEFPGVPGRGVVAYSPDEGRYYHIEWRDE